MSEDAIAGLVTIGILATAAVLAAYLHRPHLTVVVNLHPYADDGDDSEESDDPDPELSESKPVPEFSRN